MKKLTALLAIPISLQLANFAIAQISFRDDFKDANIGDGSPALWVTRDRDDGSYDVSSGDLVFKASDPYDTSFSLAADPVDFVMGDTSVIAQVRGDGPFDNIGIGARWNEAAFTGYFAGINTGGLLFVGKCDGTSCPVLNSSQLDGLHVDMEDVLLRFDAIGDSLRVWGWRPGESMPAEAQLSVEDGDYDIGTPAVFANPLANGQGIYRFINASETPLDPPLGRFGNARRVAGDGINVPGSIDASPAVSRDGLEFIFRSDRNGESDLYRVTRSSTGQPFGNLESLDALNTEFSDNGANLDVLSNELQMYFSRDDEFGNGDIYLATRDSKNDPFGNVMKLGESVNSEFDDGSPNISSDGLELYFVSDRPGSMGDWDIHVARRDSLDDPFGEPVNLGPNINSSDMDGTPNLSSDGLHLLFASPRDFGELRIASRPSTDAEFGPAVKLDDFGLGSSLHLSNAGEYDPFLSADWPAPGSKIYFSRWTTATDADLWEATWSFNGDIDFDTLLTVDDINAIMRRMGRSDAIHDIDQNGTVTEEDIRVWVEELKQTYIGDANLDGEFNSSDLTLTFQAGEYEDDVDRNSTWETGDWNGDGEFNTSDLVAAFRSGGFEQGPRTAAVAVPEPTSMVILLCACMGIIARFRSDVR